VFQFLAAVLAFLAGVLDVASSFGGDPVFGAISAASTALTALASAVITPDTSVLSCCPSNPTPCVLPCSLNSALSNAIPTLANLATGVALSTTVPAATLLGSVQVALVTLTTGGCLPSVLSPQANISALLQGTLVGFATSIAALADFVVNP
jgi:hypothetical protein